MSLASAQEFTASLPSNPALLKKVSEASNGKSTDEAATAVVAIAKGEGYDFTPAEADTLGEAMLRVRAQPGQVLIAEDEASDWMMLLLRGTVDVGKRRIGADADSDKPEDITRLAVLKEGAVLGEMSMLDGEPRYASCWALSEVEAAMLTRAAVAGLIKDHPAVGAKLLVKITQLLAQRLRNTSSQLVKVLQQKR